eukprot:COSAG01_NODE_78208_length_150_cov_11.372549_1_plen_24_part_01
MEGVLVPRVHAMAPDSRHPHILDD